MTTRRWALVVTASVGPLLLAFVWAEARRQSHGQPAAPPVPAQLPAMILHDHVERVRTRRGEVSWQFHARRADVLESGDYLVYGLDQGRYYDRGVAEAAMQADLARFESRTHNVSARGHILITSPRGLSFRAEALYWFESTGRMVVPQIRDFSWRDPARPDAAGADISTDRLFYWPREKRLEMPDPVTGRQGPNSFAAVGLSARLDEPRLTLVGPARLTVMGDASAVAGGGNEAKRIILGVGDGGSLAVNARTGGSLLTGGVLLSVPADRVEISCDRAVYDGHATKRIAASGRLRLTDPVNLLTAPRADVDTAAKRARFGGPVELTHTEPGQEPLRMTAPGLTFVYAAGRRRAVATRSVTLRSGTITATASRAEVDLEASRAVLTGRVRVLHEPRERPAAGADELRSARHLPVTITCSRLVHTFAAGSRVSVATGSPRFRQKDREGTAARMTFDQERDTLILEGGVRVWNQAGEQARAAKVIYDRGTDEMQIESPRRAEFNLRGEE